MSMTGERLATIAVTPRRRGQPGLLLERRAQVGGLVEPQPVADPRQPQLRRGQEILRLVEPQPPGLLPRRPAQTAAEPVLEGPAGERDLRQHVLDRDPLER